MEIKKNRWIPRKYFNKSCAFTLVELIVAMGVFAVIMLVMVTFLGYAQKAWSSSEQRNSIYENGKIAMDIISKDLQGAIYGNQQYPFWHWAPGTDGDKIPDYYSVDNSTDVWGEHSLGGIAFVANSYLPPNDESLEFPCEVKYEMAYGGANRGWLRRGVTGKVLSSNGLDNDKLNYSDNFCVTYIATTGPETGVQASDSLDNDSDGFIDADDKGAAFFAEDESYVSSDDDDQTWQNVIPYVTGLSFTCYDEDTQILDFYNINDANSTSPDLAKDTNFPAIVRVRISLLDKNTWDKRKMIWESLGVEKYLDNPYLEIEDGKTGSFSDDSGAGLPADKLEAAINVYEMRKANERTFTKMIFLNQ